jgi:hypothetical protein
MLVVAWALLLTHASSSNMLSAATVADEGASTTLRQHIPILDMVRTPPSLDPRNPHIARHADGRPTVVTAGRGGTAAANEVAVSIPALDIIPRTDWLNVKSFGAKADGSSDDTAAIQRVFSLVAGCKGALGTGQKNGGNATAYFPPGTYKISKTLTLCTGLGPHIRGHGATSILQWAGQQNGTMIHDNGTSYFTLEGLSFDGNGVAGIGLLHNHTVPGGNYGSLIYHVNLQFSNMIYAGAATCGG